jgi:hypothetical protein
MPRDNRDIKYEAISNSEKTRDNRDIKYEAIPNSEKTISNMFCPIYIGSKQKRQVRGNNFRGPAPLPFPPIFK